jgi:hypothetical protein
MESGGGSAGVTVAGHEKAGRIPDGDKTFLTMKCVRARLPGPEGVQKWAVWLGF